MNIISRLPVNLDYAIGILMILTSAYPVWSAVTVMIDFPSMTGYYLNELIPQFFMIAAGIVLMALPHKNLRRTIWFSTVVLGINLFVMGYREYENYLFIKEVFVSNGIIPTQDILLRFLTYCIVHFGCGIAMVITGLMFAFRKVRSLYPTIIAIVFALAIDYFYIHTTLDYNYETTRRLEEILETYIPHMLLFGLFSIVFTSDEVSWYTAKGGMTRALNRLESTCATFGICTISRDQLITLMQCDGEYTLRLRQGKFRCNLEVRMDDGVKTLVFCRSGVDSMAGAYYLRLIRICYEGTLSTCRFAEIYGEDSAHIRLNVVEPHRHISLRFGRNLDEWGYLPKFRYRVTNESLYSIVEGTGSVVIGKEKDDAVCRLDIVATENGRAANIVRANGELFSTMPVNAVVPIEEYGAYTKLFIYGDMGQYLAFKVRLPKGRRSR